MRSDWNTVIVYPNTIEMVLEAFKLNTLQKYDPYNEPSKAIRLKADTITVTIQLVDITDKNNPILLFKNIPPATVFNQFRCEALYDKFKNFIYIPYKSIYYELYEVIINGKMENNWKDYRLNDKDSVIFNYVRK